MQVKLKFAPLAAAPSPLNEFQLESVRAFANAARALTLPRSLGQIYGLLYATNDPLSLDDVVDALQISKGSVSQGLRWLRDLGAIQRVSLAGDRRDRFVAEIELRRLATGFLRSTADRHLESGEDHLRRLEEASERLPAGPQQTFSSTRAAKLRRWHRFGRRVLPVVLKMADKF